MGLDVSAYSKLHISADQSDDSDGVHVYHNPDFPGRCDEFENKTFYDVQAGSDCVSSIGYGSYNLWRDELARLAGYACGECNDFGVMKPSYAATVWNNPMPGPFMELINFSDCEGWIGTAVSAKLARDFAEFQAKADIFATSFGDERFRSYYAEFRKAFELAADGGAVHFH